MIIVTVEVGSRVQRFRLTLCAPSIERAMSMAKARYPDSEVKLLFPIDPDTFFAKDAADIAEQIRLEVPTSAVG